MHPRAAEFADRAREEYGLEIAVREFPEGTKTAADAADAIGCSQARIASSLVFVVDDRPVVVVTGGDTRVSEAALADALDATAVSMADPDQVKDALGWSIGGVPPFCHETDVDVLLDERLLSFESVWAAAGTPEAVFEIEPERIQDLSDARVVDVTS